MNNRAIASYVKPIAQTGLTAKGIVYCLLGVLAFMAAFNIAGQSTRDTNKEGVFSFIQEQTGGQIMLSIVAIGLLCYSLWRGLQTFADTEGKGNDSKGIAARGRYFFSGLVYTSLAFFAIKMVTTGQKDNGGNRQDMIQSFLSKPYGAWVVGIAAVIIIGVGLYQAWYGLAGKYKKHVEKAGYSSEQKLLVSTGKLGYVTRGIVWLILGWMLIKAVFHSNSSEAGDTAKAFGFLQDAAYGSYLLGAVGFGLVCYGIFNFIRVRYEKFT